MATVETASLITQEGTTDDVLAITDCSENAYRLANLISLDGEYVFSIWAKAAEAMTVEFRVLGFVFTASVTTEWQRLVYTISSTSTTYIDICPNSDATLYLYKGKLEQGNTATDWAPAPEDYSTSSEVSSQIKQLADSISLSVTNGTLGSTASIKLSVNGSETEEQEIDMTGVREAFANDTSAIAISAGTVTFDSNTLIVNSDNFTLDEDGNVTLTGTITAGAGSKIGGWTISDYKISSGDADTGVAVMQVPTASTTTVFAAGGTSHNSYADCPFLVTKTGKLYATDAQISGKIVGESIDISTTSGNCAGMSIVTEYNEDFDQYVLTLRSSTLMSSFGEIIISSGGVFLSGTNVNLEGDNVLLDGSVTIDDGLTVAGSVRLDADYSTGTGISCQWADYDSSATRHYVLYRGDDGLTAYFGYTGSSSYSTVSVLRGRTVKYQNSSGTTTLSDERLKEDWTSLDNWDGFFDSLKPLAFKYIDGDSGRYHIGMGAQTVEQGLLDNGLTTTDFAGLVKYKAKADEEGGYHGYDEEYGLIYTEFVGLLVDQVQKLKARVAALEAKLEEE